MELKAKRKKGIVGIEFSADLAGKKPLLGRGPKPPDEEITPTTPLRLERAAKIAFPDGSIGASALRAEARRGNLKIETIANKQYTTLANIEDMRKKCENQKGQGSGSKESAETKTESSPSAPCGSSVTERVASAQAALKATANKLKKGSANTSPQNTKLPASANVIPLKS